MEKPIILLAFANTPPQDYGYLRNLGNELNNLKYLLENVEDQGLCHLHILPNTTLEGLVHAFQRKRFRDRIAIFHYGGHALSYDLMLESETGSLEKAKSKGIIPLLASQKGLKLVFLNGCFSIKQAQQLIKAGVPAVIGTVSAVNDHIATQLSTSFYSALAQGSSFEQAWKEAIFKIQAQSEGVELYHIQEANDHFRTLSFEDPLLDTSRFPWEMHIKEGFEDIKTWSLVTASHNPYFGLPEIPRKYLYPDAPYQFLRRYKKADAKIFFGRGIYIRDLYHRLTSPHAAPLILLYGQSGVGKSSLLEAGLFPRLEKEYEIIHLRRDPEQGVFQQFERALGLGKTEYLESESVSTNYFSKWDATITQLKKARDTLKGSTYQEQLEKIIEQLKNKQISLHSEVMQGVASKWKKAWLALEAHSNKKGVIIVFDQLEEIFTRPIKEQPDELAYLLKALASIFNDGEKTPKGKVLFSYRKEYDSEIDKAIQTKNLPKEKIYLEKLNEVGIKEIVKGLSSSTQLKNTYRLHIEEGLAELIAKNILADQDSPIAPILQTILTKMWRQESKKDQRFFYISAYQKLKSKGLLLEDFFHEQMMQIKVWERQTENYIENSGLALDILSFHTTQYHTANSRSFDEITLQYSHQAHILEELIKLFQALYLLSATSHQHSSLAHDTLAPIIHREIQLSDKPGQRALRILSAKINEFERAPNTTYIDEEDLIIVEQGAIGMRVWTSKEMEMIQKSRERRDKLEAERRRNRQLKVAGVVIISILLLTVSVLWQKSMREARVNQLVSLAYQLEKQDAVSAMKRLDTAIMLAPNHKMALQTRHDIYLNNEFYDQVFQNGLGPVIGTAFSPNDSLLISCQKESIWIWEKNGSLRDSIQLGFIAKQAVFTNDSRYLFIIGQDNRLWRYHLPTSQLDIFAEHSLELSKLAYSPLGNYLLTGDISGHVIMWDYEGNSLLKVKPHLSEISTLTYSQDGNHWLSCGMDGKVYLYSQEGEQLLNLEQEIVVTSAAFVPSENSFVLGLRNGHIQKWTFAGKNFELTQGHQKRINSIQYSPNGNSALTASDDQSIILWDSSWKTIKTYHGHKDIVHEIQFSHDGEYFISASEDGTTKRWKVASKVVKTIELEDDGIQTLSRIKDKGSFLAGTGVRELTDINALNTDSDFFDMLDQQSSRKVRIYDISLNEVQSFHGHEADITAAAVHPDRDFHLTGDANGKAILWSIDGSIIKTLEAHQGQIFSLNFAPNGNYFLSGGSDNRAILWSLEGEPIRYFPHQDVVSSVYFSKNGNIFFTGSYDGIIRKWSINGELQQE